MYLEDMKKPGYFTVKMKCDECEVEYNAKVRTVWRQETVVGHHQCRKCSSRRAGKKTASHGDFSNLVNGERYSARPDIWKKVAAGKKGKVFTEEHKKALQKPKSKTEKIIEAANRPEERERRRKRAIIMMHDPKRSGRWGYCGFGEFKVGWIETNKTLSPIWYRSGLEKYFVERVSENTKVVSMESAEGIEISYDLDGKKHIYLPDFKLVLNDGSVIIVEIKGSYFAQDKRTLPKQRALEEYCKIHGFSSVLLTEKEIDKWLELLKE
jgi:hypothetical protein